MSLRFHTLTVADVRREMPEAVSLAFAVPAGLAAAYRFQPGQHVTLRARLDGEEVRRTYSICAGLDDGELRVAVKRAPGGRFSAFANERLRTGDRLDVMTPAGRFTLPPDPGAARNHLAIAAGSGITPILSIVKTVLAREPASRVTLVYGNRDTGSILFKGALEDLKDRHLGRLAVLHVLSREPRGMPLLDGRIDAAKLGTVLERVVPAATIDHAFLCGPWDLTETARAVLAAHGLPPARVHAELFTPAGPASAPPAASVAGAGHAAEAALILGGRRHRLGLLAGETIVEAAHRAGIEAPYACKGGMCCTCRARLVEGEVAMATNYGLEPWELAAGFVLTCQARPLSDRLVVDYDAA